MMANVAFSGAQHGGTVRSMLHLRGESKGLDVHA